MSRLPYEVLNQIKNKYETDRILSFSRLSTFEEHPWIYKIKYLDKIKLEQNFYGYWGNIAHDIVQDFYEGKIEYKDMIDQFNKKYNHWDLFERDKIQSPGENIEKNYFTSLRHYFSHMKPLEVNEFEVEKPTMVITKGDDMNNVLVGYIDGLYKDNEGNTHILDFKTSSRNGFAGKKLGEKTMQLKAYALGVHQRMNVPIEKIKLTFDMMKYLEVHYTLKNGKDSSTVLDRKEWVKGISRRVSKFLLDNGYDPFEIDEMMEIAILNNNFDNLPDIVREEYTIKNHYITVPVSEKELEEVKNWINNNAQSMRKLEAMDWNEAFPEPIIDNSNSFFYQVLNPGILKYHNEYQANKLMKEQMKSNEEVTEDILSDFFK